MVAKKDNKKKNPSTGKREKSGKTVNPLERLHREMENNLDQIQQHKTKIEKLTKSTIEELKSLHDLHKKANKHQPKNTNNHKFELDYELTNLKMIQKILSLATPYEAELCPSKKKTKTPIKQALPKGKEKTKTKSPAKKDTIKVLIIEDDRTTIKIITHILEQYNFKVEFAQEADEGLKKAFKEMPDLILLDIMLPGMDGFQLLKKLQAEEKTSRIPVIVLSSLSGEKDILKGLEDGATDYILKPFSPQILFFKIKKIMSLKNEHLSFDRHL
jgi:CheY-like chemotaxis protein